MEFIDCKVPYPSLYMIKKDEADKTKGTTLTVYQPATGKFAPEYTLSKEPHSSKVSLEVLKDVSVLSLATPKLQKVCILQPNTLNRGSPSSFSHPIRSSTSWRSSWYSSAPSLGEFSHVSGYWEWVEDVFAKRNKNLQRAGIHDAVWASLFTYDVEESIIRTFCDLWSPSTNSLHTAVGELSISLWDLHILGGLPLRGLFYDEVIPSAKELLEVDEDGKSFLPSSCRHLFSAYHHLGGGNSDGLNVLDWVQFWFKGSIRYREPYPRSCRKGGTKPRLSYNPSGEIPASSTRDRTTEENIPFDTLGIADLDREETYTAALLVCWICRFLVPSKNINHIRPSVFKVASMMASGEKFCLAIPVLASIYRGLRGLTSSTNLKECDATFPIHYVYGWLGSYLKTHFDNTETARKANSMRAKMVKFAGEKMERKYSAVEAQDIFESIESGRMAPFRMCKEKMQIFFDNGNFSEVDRDLFISLRPCYLVLRLDKHYVVESYNPTRFGRQFGFCQDLPQGLRMERDPQTLEAAMQLWEFSTRVYTGAKLTFPRSIEQLATHEYFQWWSSNYRNPFKDSPKVVLKLSNGACDSSKESKKKAIDSSNMQKEHTSASNLVPNGTSKPEVQATKLKRTVVESSTSESDSHRDHHWKRSKKIQLADIENPRNQEVSSKGKDVEAPNDSTHSSSSMTKEIDDDSDRLPLTQVLASHKGKATSSKIPLHLPSFSKHGVQQGDFTSSKTENVVIAFVPPYRTSPSSISTFRCDEVVARSKCKMVEMMWDDLFKQLSTTSFDGLHFIKEEVNGILQAMSQHGGIDVTSLHERVNDFLGNANQYVEESQLLSQKMKKELFDQQISGANQRLQDMRVRENQHAIHARDLAVKLTELGEKEDNLKKQLEEIANQKEEIGLSLQEDKKQLLETQSAISKIENEVSILESNPPLSEDDLMRQTNLKKELETNLHDLKNFKIFP